MADASGHEWSTGCGSNRMKSRCRIKSCSHPCGDSAGHPQQPQAPPGNSCACSSSVPGAAQHEADHINVLAIHPLLILFLPPLPSHVADHSVFGLDGLPSEPTQSDDRKVQTIRIILPDASRGSMKHPRHYRSRWSSTWFSSAALTLTLTLPLSILISCCKGIIIVDLLLVHLGLKSLHFIAELVLVHLHCAEPILTRDQRADLNPTACDCTRISQQPAMCGCEHVRSSQKGLRKASKGGRQLHGSRSGIKTKHGLPFPIY